MFKLVIQDDEGKTTVVPLIRDEITIGRKEGNTIRLDDSSPKLVTGPPPLYGVDLYDLGVGYFRISVQGGTYFGLSFEPRS